MRKKHHTFLAVVDSLRVLQFSLNCFKSSVNKKCWDTLCKEKIYDVFLSYLEF